MRGTGPVILFDGQCVMCSRGVRFVYRHDHAGVFRFAAQDTDEGRALLGRAELPGEVIVKIGDREIGGADALIYVAAQLGWPWKATLAFKVVPRGMRNWIYRLVARNRHRLFGKRETCDLPEPGLRERFVTPGDLPAAPRPPAARTPAA